MKKKRISIQAINDNKLPKIRQTNKVLGWVFLVGALIAGIYFVF